MTDATRMAAAIQITARGMLQRYTDGVFEEQNQEGESSEINKSFFTVQADLGHSVQILQEASMAFLRAIICSGQKVDDTTLVILSKEPSDRRTIEKGGMW